MKSEIVRIKAGDKKILWMYKIENDCNSLSDAIRHAIERATVK